LKVVLTRRTADEANLFNPAFCAVLLDFCVFGYWDKSARTVPLYMVPMFLPIILHRRTRMALPKAVSTSMPVWLQDNAVARVSFHERLVSLKSYSMDGVRFSIMSEASELVDGYFLKPRVTKRELSLRLSKLEGEPRECALKAQFLGRWFAASGDVGTVMALWGIKP